MRILIVNPFGIGDVLFSTPLISNLKEVMPQCHIGYVCNIRTKDVLANNSQINEIFVFEKDEYRRLWRKAKIRCLKQFILFFLRLKRIKFDLAIDLSLGHQYSLFLWLIGVKRRIGYNYRNRGRFLTDKIDITGYEDKPVADYYLDLLKFLDIKPTRRQLNMPVASQDKRWASKFFQENSLNCQDLIVGIIPAGGASWGKDFSYRHWPRESYADLADKLIQQLKIKIIIFGGPSEQNICQDIQAAMQEQALNVCAKTSLIQFAALLKQCNLVVCNDGGPLHVAVSQGVKTVAVFGPVDERVYGPYPPESRHTVVTTKIGCRPCYKKFKYPACSYNRSCIREISVTEVFNVVRKKLGI